MKKSIMIQLIKMLELSSPLIIYILEIFTTIRITYIIKNRIKPDIFKEIMTLLFIIYIVILFYVVSIPIINYQTINLKPFKEILRYPINSLLFIKNVVGNILLFIPYSFFLSFYFKINRLYKILIICLSLTLTIELIQINIKRVFDIDDIILNLISSILGYLIYKIFKKLHD